MKEKYISYFMDIAERTAELSYAKRLKVGTVIVKDLKIISCGYNGSIPGGDNELENEVKIDEQTYNSLSESERERFIYFDYITKHWIGLKTKDDIVIHSEMNAISRLTTDSISSEGSVLFCTHSCCLNCAKLIYISGIKEYYYKHLYRDFSGLNFLNSVGVKINHYV